MTFLLFLDETTKREPDDDLHKLKIQLVDYER